MNGFWYNRTTNAFGEDMFGEPFAAREMVDDKQNKDLYLKMFTSYQAWHRKNHKFSP